MRTKNSIKNIVVGIMTQLIMVIIGFVSRRVFVDILGYEMLGINQLFISIISMLSLTEFGIGTAIICKLYKPLADNDEHQVKALIQFFKKTYRFIALTIIGLGAVVTPFLKVFIKEDIGQPFLIGVFVLFLIDAILPYFFAHKRNLIFADQKNYIVSLVSSGSTILASAAQIALLILTKNYILFLSIKIVIRLIENVILTQIANRKYPYIRSVGHISLDRDTRKDIASNTKALSLHYIGNYLINGTDSIIISSFLGALINGYYANYSLIITTLTTLLNQFSIGLLASFGNMISIETKEKSYDVFERVNFVNYVIYQFAAISLLCLINPFIAIWINDESVLSIPTVIVLSLNFYIVGISGMLGSIRASAGIFRPDRYLHLMMAALNIVVSIVLVKVIGIIGVFIGTMLCLLIKEVSVLPSIVYREIFCVRVREYYKDLAVYFFTTFFTGAIAMYICTTMITGGGIPWLLVRLAVCIIIPNGVVVILFRKTREYKYTCDLLSDLLLRFKKILKAN